MASKSGGILLPAAFLAAYYLFPSETSNALTNYSISKVQRAMRTVVAEAGIECSNDAASIIAKPDVNCVPLPTTTTTPTTVPAGPL